MKRASELTREQEVTLRAGECPDCGGKQIVEGPHGGLSVNLACAKCGSEFNWSPIFVERNSIPGNPDYERLHSVFGITLSEGGTT